MFERVIFFRLLLLCFLACSALLLYVVPPVGSLSVAEVGSSASEPVLTVAFLDVGQGDAIYIETPDGIQLLIDGGRDGAILRELAQVMPFLDRSLDVVLATHTDQDHIGGLVDVLARYKVSSVVLTENKNDTSVAEAFLDALAAESATIHYARAGQQYQLGASTTLFILSPHGDPTNWESNAASIVALLEYGETSFLFTGDAGVNTEEYLVGTFGSLLTSDVLKLGHHGSDTSTGELFLDTVRPGYAVVSAGKDNSYGHPHEAVTSALSERGIPLFSTAESGTVVFKSDGRQIWHK